jgi:hypothetical protein
MGARLETVKTDFDVYMLRKVLWCTVAGKPKLDREFWDEPENDLTKRFPSDPLMHMINLISGRSVVTKEEKCCGSVPMTCLSACFVSPTQDSSSILSIALSFAFDVFIVVVIFRRVFGNDQPNSETIFGALCIYLLVGFAFASLYSMVDAIQPKAFYFDPRTNLHAIPNRFDFIYYSFATMVSMGAGGITAVSAPARSLSVIEAIIGVLYLAVLIARLMGAYRHPSVSGRT